MYGVRRAAPALVCLLLGILVSTALLADDRDLYVKSGAPPYVMTILDTSSSMHRPIAGGGALASSDDPSSRLYLAKAALYEVLQGIEGDPPVFGFAHFNQEDLVVKQKHWLYRIDETFQSIPWAADLPWPSNADAVVFGDGSVVEHNDEDHDGTSCDTPFDGSNSEVLAKLSRFPKLGSQGTSGTTIYVQYGSATYSIGFQSLPAGTLGREGVAAHIDVVTTVAKWNICGVFPAYVKAETLRFDPYYLADEEGRTFTRDDGSDLIQLPTSFLAHSRWEDFWGQEIRDISAKSACNSNNGYWDPNDTDPTDLSVVTYPTSADPSGRGFEFSRGDMIPWDWKSYPQNPAATGFEFATRTEMMRRLAPNTTIPGEYALDAEGRPIPDFRVARYFDETLVNGSEIELRPQYVNQPPIMNGGGTPLEGVMVDLGDWFDDWKTVAEVQDPQYECRQRFLILLTDGAESCSSNAAAAAAAGALFDKGIKVFVIGFAGDIDAGALEDIAEEGGTGAIDKDGDGTIDCEQYGGELGCTGPFLPETKQELVDALTSLFSGVEGTPSSFTSAAPQPSSALSNQAIHLATFEPVPSEPVWKGTARKFVNPLPLLNGVPDTSQECTATRSTGCFAWDAGEAILGRGPLAIDQTATVESADFGLGHNPNQRRVYYAVEPGNPNRVNWGLRMMTPATTMDSSAIRWDQWNGFGIPFITGDSDSESDAAIEAENIVRTNLAPRPASAAENDKYLLGDFFHSDPTLIWRPTRAEYLRESQADGVDCRDGAGNFEFSDAAALGSYRCFFERNQYRRQILLMGSNDGQVHAFDSGTFEYDLGDGISTNDPDDRLTLGSGQELFSYVPRLAMPHLRQIASSSGNHGYGVDGPFQVDDFLIDPDHDGTPTLTQREWRTVAIGGLREGGRGYHAIDLTYPDWVIQGSDPQKTVLTDTNGNYLPSCLTNYTNARCGSIPYPAVLWEFTDQTDEDNVGGPDLALTWSAPNTGRIRVSDGGTIVTRYVAIFGGGFDPQLPNQSGNFLYMVDVETGKILYKRAVIGSVPSEPAAVDTNNDSFIDTIYFGTTAGFMYKVDLTLPVLINDSFLPHPRVTAPEWEPFIVFDTGNRPIFYPPSVIFLAQKSKYALAFGTGNRENLWQNESPPEEGRFFVIVDSSFEQAAFQSGTGFTEANLQSVDAANGFDTLSDVLLEQVAPGDALGYALRLGSNERMVSSPITLIGLMVFSTYTPDGSSATGCDNNGSSNLYTLFAASGNPLTANGRFRTVEGFVGTPFTQTNTTSSSTDGSTPEDQELTDDLKAIRDTLEGQLPRACRFNNTTIDVKAVRSDTGIEYLAPVPVCLVQKNWKEIF